MVERFAVNEDVVRSTRAGGAKFYPQVRKMMGYYSNMMTGWSFFGSLTWLLLIVFLALGTAYFWKGLNKK